MGEKPNLPHGIQAEGNTAIGLHGVAPSPGSGVEVLSFDATSTAEGAMTLLLTEQDVRELAPMEAAVEALEATLKRQGQGKAFNQPRRRLHLPDGGLQVMPAADLGTGMIGFKTYSTSGRGARFHVLLYRIATGELLAMVQARTLGAIRTGAASGIATRYMARDDASTLGIVGAGGQARTQVAGVCAVRPIEQVLVYSRDPERRKTFAERIAATLKVEARPVETPQEAVAAPIVTTATTSAQPVLLGQWLRPGTHINAIGSNSIIKRELDLEAVRRADRIVVDDREQAALECGDLLEAWERGIVHRQRLPELGEVVAGNYPGRTSEQEITLFESQGIGLWDIALAELVYRRAREAGRGTETPL